MYGSKEPLRTDKENLLKRLKTQLHKTKKNLFDDLNKLISKKGIDTGLLDELEERLLLADVGATASKQILDTLQAETRTIQTDNHDQLRQSLAEVMCKILAPAQNDLLIPADFSKPLVILLAGVNGAGKTTTAGKLAHYFIDQGNKVILAACDTFRAAATEQLQAWGDRNQVAVIAQAKGADPSAVIYDALQSAQKNNIDILIADTAGRMHTKDDLMAQLAKIHRTIGKFDKTLTAKNMLVLDSTTGQNAISQVKQFHSAINIDGIVLTKLDGTAKGGVIFALAIETGIPIDFIGIGEQIDDLQTFDGPVFVEALLQNTST